MPEISRFFGIVIRMFSEPGAPHHRPHFHAYYQEHSAVFRDRHGRVDWGALPRRQQRLVEAWAELHLEELGEDWELLQAGHLPIKIEPLQ
jgi:hypothetical protein